MAIIITVANQKGGVGKTTTVYNLAASLADAGARVLAIDFDPQGSLTFCYGIEPEQITLNMYHVICRGEPLENILVRITENISLAPSDIDLSAAELEIASKMSRESLLTKALSKVAGMYDFILIDAQPSLSLLPVNALAASDYVLVPVPAEILTFKGLQLLEHTIKDVTENINKRLSILGVIVTMYDGRTRHANEVLDMVKTDWPILGVVDRAIAVQDAVLATQPITSFDPESKPAVAYREIAAKLLKLKERK